MTQINYQALREAAEKATQGNWWIDSHGQAMVSFIDNDVLEVFATDNKRSAVRHEDTGNLSRWRNDNDATFIATADPATVLALLDELEAAEKLIDTLRQDKDKVIDMSIERINKLLSRAESAEKRIAELEKSEEQLINERDHAESALADMYFAATGDRPEWSNCFSFSDAVDAVVDRIADLEAKQPSPIVPEGLVKAVRFYEQVKRENPPVETGAWKDAVDWVLKEVCQVVNIRIKGE